MINYLIKSFEFDIAYSVNSFIYILRGLPILKDLLTEDVYKDNLLKKNDKSFYDNVFFG